MMLWVSEEVRNAAQAASSLSSSQANELLQEAGTARYAVTHEWIGAQAICAEGRVVSPGDDKRPHMRCDTQSGDRKAMTVSAASGDEEESRDDECGKLASLQEHFQSPGGVDDPVTLFARCWSKALRAIFRFR
ncbi:hypothetical protein DF3PB_10134 [uncultured Defluviicoccus sp.]|uniref:Uncharacterized protein n=1 Tax=metagenome TaxID=256318 RepID=A0A380T8G0_9ZZZZ|nr:hypothetical protein DF3PB_10134 [uncultured Defluviicoccus sp.]